MNKNIVIFVWICTLSAPMVAMLSKPTHVLEEKIYTEQEIAHQEKLNKDLLEACLKQQIKNVRLLLNAGADPDMEDEDGATLLGIMASLGFLDVIKVLLENGADINTRSDVTGYTPLYVAVMRNNQRVVDYLVQKGADVSIRNKAGMNPFIAACWSEDVALVNILINYAADKEIEEGLFFACTNNKTDKIIKILIQKNVNINVKYPPFSLTSLHFACLYGNVQMAQTLLKAGADPIAETVNGVTPVEIACELNEHRIIQLFNKHGIRTKSQEEADELMHKFFAELNEEKIKKIVVQSQKKELKKAEPNKTTIAQKETEKLQQEQFPETTPVTTSTTSTTSTTTTTPVITNLPSRKIVIPKKTVTAAKEEKGASITQENMYVVVEGKKLKWPKALKPNQEKLIEEHIRALTNLPEHGLDIKKLKNQPGMYRLRVGGYRIIFSVNNKTHVITVEEIGLRKNIYKNLSFKI